MALSARGTTLAKAFHMRGNQNFWDPETNPNGIVSFLNSENVCCHCDLPVLSEIELTCVQWLLRDRLAEYVKTHVRNTRNCETAQLSEEHWC